MWVPALITCLPVAALAAASYCAHRPGYVVCCYSPTPQCPNTTGLCSRLITTNDTPRKAFGVCEWTGASQHRCTEAYTTVIVIKQLGGCSPQDTCENYTNYESWAELNWYSWDSSPCGGS